MPLTPKPVFLKASKIFLIAITFVFLTGCLSVEKVKEKYATSEFYFDTEHHGYQTLIDWYGDIWNGKKYILEINEPALKLRDIAHLYPVSFTVANMPLDMKDLLKSNRPEDTSYTDYYDFINQNADRIIFCDNMKGPLGFVQGYYKDPWPYESESVIFINAQNLKFFWFYDKYWQAATTIVHEAAHKEILRLIDEDKIPSQYGRNELTERHANVREVEFMEKINWVSDDVVARLRDYNRRMGLPNDDMTVFYPKEKILEMSSSYSQSYK